ncbi:MBL fold metallo-hydrolase [Lignipirellula cremea]|uniref:MBL fold metallo-hydrolase n=1 Tax=Lignipirellula cremea TaxID=2528010 RepID=UPI0018D24D73|nr:MBL fold metallo-hydrolase [Lignipirellula cremea]
MPENEIIIQSILSQPFAENAYVFHLKGRSDCLILDPGFEPDPILEYVAQQRLTPAAILNTHGHVDHIAGNEAMKRCWPETPLLIGFGDAEKLTNARLNLSGDFGAGLVSPPADQLLHHGEQLQLAGFQLEVRDAPGHSSGHIVFIWQGASPARVFGGDVLFRESVGRTDFFDGDFNQLATAIHTQLFPLPDDTIVYPGHGPETTIGYEKANNPYVGEPSGFSL